MKVKTWVEVEQEVEVDVCLGDVLAELSTLPDNQRWATVASAVNCAHGVLSRISDAAIAEMTEYNRNLIGQSLLVQARRYLGKELEL